MESMTVKVVGADQALRALRTIEPSVAREVGRDLTKIGRMYQDAVEKATPSGAGSSNWRATSGARGSRGGAGWPAWSDLSFRTSRRGMTVFVTGTSASPAIASMYETMGRNTRVRTKSGAQLIKLMNEKFGAVAKSGSKVGRFRRIAGEHYAEAVKQIDEACARAVAEVNRRMP